ncbi:MAG: hypothetical protein LQ350_001319 [Teloschistes chrysophthalmus]|nr:MAG: hypothetical protein LQ350_001319 [Niorma chrysophthalma]
MLAQILNIFKDRELAEKKAAALAKINGSTSDTHESRRLQLLQEARMISNKPAADFGRHLAERMDDIVKAGIVSKCSSLRVGHVRAYDQEFWDGSLSSEGDPKGDAAIIRNNTGIYRLLRDIYGWVILKRYTFKPVTTTELGATGLSKETKRDLLERLTDAHAIRKFANHYVSASSPSPALIDGMFAFVEEEYLLPR